MPRPGWKHLEVVGPDGRTSLVNVRENRPAEPSQAELEEEIRGAVSLGWQTRGHPGSAGRAASWHKYEVLVDLRNWNKTWSRNEDGVIFRNFSTEKSPPGEDLGTIPSSPREPQIFSPAPEPTPTREKPNPLDSPDLDPAVREAIVHLLGR